MNDFKRSLLFCGAICACITAPLLMLAFPFAHQSCISDWSRDMSKYSLLVGIVLLFAGIFGLQRSPSRLQRSVKEDYSPNRYATASIVLCFPVFGMMTWGIASLAGIVFGILGLRKACLNDGVGGRERAIAGICISFAIFPLMILLVLFLGP